jgi:MYXO-CTERM domain-containing protein
MPLANDVTTTPEDCRLSPGIDKHLYAAVPPDVEQAVRLILLSLENVDPLPNGTLFTCTYRIDADATPGRHPIACAGQGASTPDGDAIEEAFRCLDGAVIISGPTPPPTATPKSGTHESVDGSGSGDGCQVDQHPSAGSALWLLLPLAAMLRVRRRR